MSNDLSIHQDELMRDIQKSLDNAEINASRSKKFNSTLLITSSVTAAASTLVTGVTAANGPVIGEGTTGWVVSCAVAAVFGFITTVCIGINQSFGFAERLSRLNECTGRLKSLDVSIKTDRASWDNIVTEYEQIVRDYTDEIRG